MDEGFDFGTDFDVGSDLDLDVGIDSDLGIDSFDINDDITGIDINDSFIGDDLSGLKEEANSLDIEPFEEGMYDNIGDVDFNSFDGDINSIEPEDYSSAEFIGDAFLNQFNSDPSDLANLGAQIIAPQGMPTETLAQTLQGGVSALAAFGHETMAGAIDQYGINGSAMQQNIMIEQAIADGIAASGRTGPIEPLLDNQDIICGETRINLTDESLRED